MIRNTVAAVSALVAFPFTNDIVAAGVFKEVPVDVKASAVRP
jgi:hypothetical protein